MSVTNWAGNQTFSPAVIHHPTSLAELQAVLAASGAACVRVFGTLHSFNRIVDSPDVLICLDKMTDGVPLAVDEGRSRVIAPAGLRYGDLMSFLASTPFACHNSASLPHISVAGAIATATHGSGVSNGNLATAVVAMDLLTADGSVLRLSAGDDDFPGAVVHLGALGVVVSLTLAVQPSFTVRQDVFERLPFPAAVSHFQEIMSSGYSVSMFTKWGDDVVDQVWVKSLVASDGSSAPVWPTGMFGAVPAVEKVHPIPGAPAECCTDQLGAPGPSHDRLPHFKLDFTPSVGEELQSEYFVSIADAPAALEALYGLRGSIAPILHVSEVRTIAADDLWLSPQYGRASVAFHFTWLPKDAAVRAVLPLIEAALEPFAPRPHWGKLYTLPPKTIAQRYPKFADFAALAAKLDPARKFANKYVTDLLDAGLPQ